MSDDNSRFVRIETQLDTVATKEWVREFSRAYNDGLRAVERAVDEIRFVVKATNEKCDRLFDAHTELLKTRAEQEAVEHAARMADLESKTVFSVLTKKVGPVIGVVVSIITFVGVIAGALSWWIVNQVLPHAK